MQNKSKYIYVKCNKQKDIKLNNVKRRYEENKLTLIDRDNSYYLICHIESGKISVPQLINNKNEKEISDLKLLLKIVNEDLSLFNIKDFLGYAIDLYNIEMISKNKENCLVNKNKNCIPITKIGIGFILNNLNFNLFLRSWYMEANKVI